MIMKHVKATIIMSYENDAVKQSGLDVMDLAKKDLKLALNMQDEDIIDVRSYKYQKIQSIFKRYPKGHEQKGQFIEGQYSIPELEFLKDMTWIWEEKIDGMNVMVVWNGTDVQFVGRTADAQVPKHLLKRLEHLFPVTKFKEHYPDKPMALFGEGFGAKIQGGGKYIKDGADFILFDVLIGGIWVQRESVEDIGNTLGIDIVPIVGHGTILEAIDAIKKGVKSTFGDFLAEGLVLKLKIPLLRRNGDRIVTKIKHKDYKVIDPWA